MVKYGLKNYGKISTPATIMIRIVTRIPLVHNKINMKISILTQTNMNIGSFLCLNISGSISRSDPWVK
jgi:hypothetical protein